MWPFSSKPRDEPKPQSLGDMIEYSLKNEATRSTWKPKSGERELASADLAMALDCRWPRGNHCYVVKRANGQMVPLPAEELSKISDGIKAWRQWDDERKRTNALVAFVDKFEAAYGTKESLPR